MDEAYFLRGERRIEYLTLGFGAAAALATGMIRNYPEGAGVAVGAVLAWINFRWLKLGIRALERAWVLQPDGSKVRAPKRAWAKFFGRYALLGGSLYVIFAHSLLPLIAVVGGLFALVAAVLVELVYELILDPGQMRAG